MSPKRLAISIKFLCIYLISNYSTDSTIFTKKTIIGEIGSKREDESIGSERKYGRVSILSSLGNALLFTRKRDAQRKRYVRAEYLGRDLIRDRHARERDEKTIGRKNVKRHQSLGSRVRLH